MRSAVCLLFAGLVLGACASGPSVTTERWDTIPAPELDASRPEAPAARVNPPGSDLIVATTTTTTEPSVEPEQVDAIDLPVVIDPDEDPASDVASFEGLRRLDSGVELSHLRTELHPLDQTPYHFEHIGPPVDSFPVAPSARTSTDAIEEVVDVASTFEVLLMSVRMTDGDTTSERLASIPAIPDTTGALTGESVVLEPTTAGVVVGVSRGDMTTWYLVRQLSDLIDPEPVGTTPGVARRLVVTTEGPMTVDDEGIARVSSDLVEWQEVSGVRDNDGAAFVVDDVCTNRYVTLGVGSINGTSEQWVMVRTGSKWLPLRRLPAPARRCEANPYDMAAVVDAGDQPTRIITEYTGHLQHAGPTDEWPMPPNVDGQDATVEALRLGRGAQFLAVGSAIAADGTRDAQLWIDGVRPVVVADGPGAQNASSLYRIGAELFAGGTDNGIATLWRLDHLDAAPAPGADVPDRVTSSLDITLAPGSTLTPVGEIAIETERRTRRASIEMPSGDGDTFEIPSATDWTQQPVRQASDIDRVRVNVAEIEIIAGSPVAVVEEDQLIGPGLEPVLARLFRWNGDEWAEWAPIDAPPAAHIELAPTTTGTVVAYSTLTSTDFYWMDAVAAETQPVRLASIDTRVVELHVTETGQAIALTERRVGDPRRVLLSSDLATWTGVGTIGGSPITGLAVCGDDARRFAVVYGAGNSPPALVDLTHGASAVARPVGPVSHSSCAVVGDDVAISDVDQSEERLLLVSSDELETAPLRQLRVADRSGGSAMISHEGGVLGAMTIFPDVDDAASIPAAAWLWYDDGVHHDEVKVGGSDGSSGFSAIAVHDGVLHAGGFGDDGAAVLWSGRAG